MLGCNFKLETYAELKSDKDDIGKVNRVTVLFFARIKLLLNLFDDYRCIHAIKWNPESMRTLGRSGQRRTDSQSTDKDLNLLA